MRFEVLGPVRAHDGADVITMSGALRRTLLAMLLARANQPVSVDTLLDGLWGSRPVARAPQRLQLQVHRLRGVLDDPERLSFTPGGYCLWVRPGELDSEQFSTLLDEAHDLEARDPHQCAQLIRTALGLWRGTPYQNVDVPDLAGEIQRLSECRLVAVEDLYTAECRRGRHGAIIGELSELVQRYPLRERLHGLLMTALYQGGRQADALAAYRNARDILGTELGLDPCPELRAIERRILVGEPALSADVPAQLPHNVAGFVGREAELSQLDQLLAQGGESALISAVAGTAGVGKTALAVRWAHRVKDRFPDGQLYVDLRGYGPHRSVSPDDVLAAFLRALGMDARTMPQDLAERAARFRSLVAHKRLLIVLDNAHNADQVRPLLPGSPTSFVIVTSRDSLTGLAARDGAQRIELDRLTSDEAERLVKELLGDQDGAAELIERCAHLPLALRIAVERVRERPHQRISDFLAELADGQARLDMLDSGDPHTSVRAVFDASYRCLDADAARLFRLMGVHPCPDIDVHALTALNDVPATRRSLETLVRAHLVEETTSRRYRLHDLLATYAAELADTAGDTGAQTRLLDYYLYTAKAAANFVFPRDPHSQAVTSPPIRSYEAAVRWLDTERVNLIRVACDHSGYTTDFSAALIWYLDIGCHLDDGQRLHAKALTAARRNGDAAAEGVALRALGLIHFRRDRFTEAEHDLAAALALHETEDISRAETLTCLGALYGFTGPVEAAIQHLRKSADLLRKLDRPLLAQWALMHLGLLLHRRCGRYEMALAHLREALTMAEEHNYPPVQAHTAYGLAGLYRDTGRCAEALDYANRALSFADKAGFAFLKGLIVHRLGTIHQRLGDYDKAQQRYREARSLARATSNTKLEAMALNGAAEAHAAAGESAKAARCHADALTLAPQHSAHYQRARAHAGLGDINDQLNDPDTAIAHWQQALAIYRGLHAPEVAEIQHKLAVSCP